MRDSSVAVKCDALVSLSPHDRCRRCGSTPVGESTTSRGLELAGGHAVEQADAAAEETGAMWTVSSSSRPARRYCDTALPPPWTWMSLSPASRAGLLERRLDAVGDVGERRAGSSSSGARSWWVRTNTGWWKGGSSPHQPRALGSSSQGPSPLLYILRPMIPAPTRALSAAMWSESALASPPSRLVRLAPRDRVQRPLVQLHPADAERVLQGRVRAGDEAVEGDGEVGDEDGSCRYRLASVPGFIAA